MRTADGNRYSSNVEINLVVGDRTIPVAEVGQDYAVLRQDLEVPECTATIELTVDGSTELFNVYLYNGIQAGQRVVRFF